MEVDLEPRGIPPKLHHFFLRACNGSLATKRRLKDRHIITDGSYDRCQCGEEPIIHVIFYCSLAAPILQNSPFTNYLNDALTISFMPLWLWMHERLNKEDLLSFEAMTWAAWSCHNAVLHNDPWKSIEVGGGGFP